MSDLDQIFHNALALPEPQRSTYLDSACAGDPNLLSQVQSLLLHAGHPTGGLQEAIAPLLADWAQSLDLAPGQLLGRYRIESKLGEGGMGAVYAAFDTQLQRPVAIKLLRSVFRQPAHARRLFAAEARSAAALSHPNIATLYDAGETEGLPWLVMELVAGTSLRDKLRSGPLHPEAALRFAHQIAEGLSHAHSRGIVHGDIKPENILIANDGVLKIIDFGIARILSECTDEAPSLGTPAYAAPELALGQPVTPAADVFSFGLVAYEMLAGHRPSASSSPLAASAPALASLIDRCLAVSPDERFAQGNSLAAALRRLVISTPAPHRDPLAIVDFSNTTANPDLDWLSVGLAETLSVRLARLPSLQIIRLPKVREQIMSPSAVPDPAPLAASLSARWVLTGSFQKVAETVRVHFSLFDAISPQTPAHGTVDGHWHNLFEIQDSLSSQISRQIEINSQPRLSPDTRNLLAYEHYAKGRSLMHLMRSGALAEAIGHFEEALALDPSYALVLSSLGTCFALQFLRTSNPEDIKRADGYLERALILDPELAEPYPWLANIRLRKNNAPASFDAARQGILLQPDLPEAQYFFGGIHYMAAECGMAAPAVGLPALAEAIRLQPTFHPAWLLLGALLLYSGRHRHAILVLDEVLRRADSPSWIYPFVGFETLRATAILRQGRWPDALTAFADAYAGLERGPDHLYRSCFLTLSAGGLGHAALRLGDYATALAHFRQSWRIVREAPRMAGSPRLLIRAALGLSAAYAATGDFARARELFADAAAQLPELAAQLSSLTFECSLAQLHLDFAVAASRLGEQDRALAHLSEARLSSWCDATWLRTDPELQPLRHHPSFVAWLAELDAAAPHPAILIPGVSLA